MTHPTYKTYQFQITQFEFKKPIRKKRKNLKKKLHLKYKITIIKLLVNCLFYVDLFSYIHSYEERAMYHSLNKAR